MNRILIGWIAGGLLACQSSDPVVFERAWPAEHIAVVLFLNDSGTLLTPTPIVVPADSDRIQVDLDWDDDYQTLVHVYSTFAGGALIRRGLVVGGETDPVRARPLQTLLADSRAEDESGPILVESLETSRAPIVDLRFRGPETRRTFCDGLQLDSRMLLGAEAVPLIAAADRDHYYLRLRDEDRLDELVLLRSDGTIEPHGVPGLAASPSHLRSNGRGMVYGVSGDGLFEISPATATATIAPVLGNNPHLATGVAGEMYVWDRNCIEAPCPVRRVEGTRHTRVFDSPPYTYRLQVLGDDRALALTTDGVRRYDGETWALELPVEGAESARLAADAKSSVLYAAGTGFRSQQDGAWSCVPDLDTSEDCHAERSLEFDTEVRLWDGYFAFLPASDARLIFVGPEGLCSRSFPGDNLNDLDANEVERALVAPTRRIPGFTRTVIWTLTHPGP